MTSRTVAAASLLELGLQRRSDAGHTMSAPRKSITVGTWSFASDTMRSSSRSSPTILPPASTTGRRADPVLGEHVGRGLGHGLVGRHRDDLRRHDRRGRGWCWASRSPDSRAGPLSKGVERRAARASTRSPATQSSMPGDVGRPAVDPGRARRPPRTASRPRPPEERGDDAGEDVAGAGRAPARVRRRVDDHAAVGRRDHGARPLQRARRIRSRRRGAEPPPTRSSPTGSPSSRSYSPSCGVRTVGAPRRVGSSAPASPSSALSPSASSTSGHRRRRHELAHRGRRGRVGARGRGPTATARKRSRCVAHRVVDARRSEPSAVAGSALRDHLARASPGRIVAGQPAPHHARAGTHRGVTRRAAARRSCRTDPPTTITAARATCARRPGAVAPMPRTSRSPSMHERRSRSSPTSIPMSTTVDLTGEAAPRLEADPGLARGERDGRGRLAPRRPRTAPVRPSTPDGMSTARPWGTPRLAPGPGRGVAVERAAEAGAVHRVDDAGRRSDRPLERRRPVDRRRRARAASTRTPQPAQHACGDEPVATVVALAAHHRRPVGRSSRRAAGAPPTRRRGPARSISTSTGVPAAIVRRSASAIAVGRDDRVHDVSPARSRSRPPSRSASVWVSERCHAATPRSAPSPRRGRAARATVLRSSARTTSTSRNSNFQGRRPSPSSRLPSRAKRGAEALRRVVLSSPRTRARRR